jgi:hypothetical protein
MDRAFILPVVLAVAATTDSSVQVGCDCIFCIIITAKSCKLQGSGSGESVSMKFGSCRVRSYIETCHYRDRESVSDSISAIEAPACGTRAHCERTILTTLYHMHNYRYAATGDLVKFHYIPSSNLLS